nr:hypothetical protein StreXyl84_14460 [Streptomyces sp. Xyl84]
MDLKLYVGERLNGTEPLGDPAQRQHGRSGHVNHLLRRLTRREVVQKFGGMFRPAPRTELAGLNGARGAGGAVGRPGSRAGGLGRGAVRGPGRPLVRGGGRTAVRGPGRTAYLTPYLSQSALYLPVQIWAAV